MAEATIHVSYRSLPPIDVLRHETDSRGNIFTLTHPLKCGCGIEIPAGFESDGASVPRRLWHVVFPPDDMRAMFAAIVHDWEYRTHPDGVDKHEADLQFRYHLLRGGVSRSAAKWAYWGVRLFGGKAWKAGGKTK